MPISTPIQAECATVPGGGKCADNVCATLAGDARCFDALVENYFGMIYAIGLAHLGDAALAQDLAQEVFLRAYLCLDQLKNPDWFPGWITRMARNLAIDWL